MPVCPEPPRLPLVPLAGLVAPELPLTELLPDQPLTSALPDFPPLRAGDEHPAERPTDHVVKAALEPGTSSLLSAPL